MSMMCCERCGHAHDTDFKNEVVRYGYVFLYNTTLMFTGSEINYAVLCDNCFDPITAEQP